MDGIPSALSAFLVNIDFRRPLPQSLANLQQTLQRHSISLTSQIGLQAYQHICQEYINIGRRKANPNAPHKHSSRHISVASLIKPQPHVSPQPDKSLALMVVVKRHYLRRLMRLAQMDDESVRRDDERNRNKLRMEMAKFQYKIKVWRKFILAIQEEKTEYGQMQARADQFADSKKECILQEYFLAWRDEALMSEEERAYREELECKYEQLSKLVFVRRFVSERRAKESRKQLYDEKTEHLRNTIKTARILFLFHSLSAGLDERAKHQDQVKQLSVLRKRRMLVDYMRTMKKVITYRTISDQRRLATVNKMLFPRILLKKMRASLQLRKVYFKNGKKIIFLTMLLGQIKEGLQRKGYDYSWMKQFPQSLQFTDGKLGFPYRKHCLAKAFTKFGEQLQIERQQMQAIKMGKGDFIIKQLLYNYKLSIIKQKQKHKTATLQAVLTENTVSRVFVALRSDYGHRSRQQQLYTLLDVGRAKQAIQFLKASNQISKQYRLRVQSFKEKSKRNRLQIIFRFLKTILLTQKVNRRLVEQFQNYTNRLKTQRIFQCFKDYSFSEQLIKRRQRNVARIRLSRYADQLFYNLKVDLYGHAKRRVLTIQRNQAKVRIMRVRKAFGMLANKFRRENLRAKLNEQIDREYEARFKWKMFNLLKVITERRQDEKAKVKFIIHKQQKRQKEIVLDKMLTKLLLSLLIKRINAKLDMKILRNSWQKLKKAQHQPSSVIEYSFEKVNEGNSPNRTSEFKGASPSFDLSSDMEEGLQ